MKKIENFIEHLESPSLNGIIFSNGIIKILDVKNEWSPQIKYSIKEKNETSIEELNINGYLQWNDCAVMTELTDKIESINVIAGEGDYGSDGFVGVIDLNSKKLIWLAFFNCSNPFNELEIKAGRIYARSTNGCIWKFKLKNPVDIIVECCTDGNGTD